MLLLKIVSVSHQHVKLPHTIWCALEGEEVLCYMTQRHDSSLPLSRIQLYVQFPAHFHVILCLILIPTLELWPVTEENANMIQIWDPVFWPTSVLRSHPNSDSDNNKKVFMCELVFMCSLTWNGVWICFHNFADCKLNYAFWMLLFVIKNKTLNDIWLLLLFW